MSTTAAPSIRDLRQAPASRKPNFGPMDENGLHPLVNAQQAADSLYVLILFRFVNALCVRTFFQPDEYFQSLEPAWRMAFGEGSGAWITWEWHHQLRSSLHPAIFAALLFAVDKPMELMQFFPQFRAMIISVVPNVGQGLVAAAGDYFTWQLAQKVYGKKGNVAWAAFLMTLFSPWQWFCSTRTFSNCLETTLTIAALNYWPWDMTLDLSVSTSSASKTEADKGVFATTLSLRNLRYSLLLAGLACILRPTNLLIWFSIVMPTLLRLISPTTSAAPKTSDYLILLREAVLCGSLILAISAISDYFYFGALTFPPYQWLNFNISQDLAVFYGRNDWHYYFSQGLPLLLTTYTPFALVALYQSIAGDDENKNGAQMRGLLTKTVFTTLGSLSFISHKEVRFIYPLLPLLHIIAAPTISAFFTTPTATLAASSSKSKPSKEAEPTSRRGFLLALLLLTNISSSAYVTQIHQRGVMTVMTFLRNEYEATMLSPRGLPIYDSQDSNFTSLVPTDVATKPFVSFLMPCHSTPWRSQLFYEGLNAWALSCEPPLHLAHSTIERQEYKDEADRFYDDGVKFLRDTERAWPTRFVAGFEGVESVLRESVLDLGKDMEVKEVWRAFNSHWIDDERRAGDVVVWEIFESERT